MNPKTVDCSFRPDGKGPEAKKQDVNCGFDPDAAKAPRPEPAPKESAKSRK